MATSMRLFIFDVHASSENYEESDHGRDLNFANRLALIACFIPKGTGLVRRNSNRLRPIDRSTSPPYIAGSTTTGPGRGHGKAELLQ